MKQKRLVSMNSLTHLPHRPGNSAYDIERVLAREVCPPPDPKLGYDSLGPRKQITGSRIETLQKQHNSASSHNSK